jgi:hypothetical protein
MTTKLEKIGFAERLGNWVDDARYWITKSWKLGALMAKGAYLVTERRRLLRRLGEETYYRMLKHEISSADLEPLVQQLERLTKKIEIEELLVLGIRFGKRRAGRTLQRTSQERG